jgi:hypothetical protein
MSILRTLLASISLLLIGAGIWSLLTESDFFGLQAIRAPAILCGAGALLSVTAFGIFEWQKRRAKT